MQSSASNISVTPSIEVLVNKLMALNIMCGFGVSSLDHCQSIKKLLDTIDKRKRPCVAILHSTGNLFFFVCFQNPQAVAASNSSSLSSLTRRFELLEANQTQLQAKVEMGQKQLEAKVDMGQKQLEVKLDMGQKQVDSKIEQILMLLSKKG